MAKVYWNKILILVVSAIIIFFASTTQVDNDANARIDTSFKQALSVFATTKALNAVISLVQGTEVGPPGVTITIGEVLDPINDLVERFSWVMLASLTSLGIEKILMNIVSFPLFNTMLIVTLIISNILYFIKFKNYTTEKNIFFKFTILLIFLRYSIPFMTLANDYVYINFVRPSYNIELSQEAITKAKDSISSFDDKKSSIFSTSYYKNKMKNFQKFASDIGNHIVDLLIVFIFQTILFPLLFLFMLYKFIGYLMKLKTKPTHH